MLSTNAIDGCPRISECEVVAELVVVIDSIGYPITNMAVQIAQDVSQPRPEKTLWRDIAKNILQVIDRLSDHSGQVRHRDGPVRVEEA
jgi:hypothetical protein